MIVRLLLAMAAGMLVGVDRERKNRGAGMKTHVLVCIGAALAMMTSEYIYHEFPDARADMARIGAQVVSGVGFLGVGTIMVTGKNQIRGLTTAAGLWASACAGIAIGIGFVEGALGAIILIMFTQRVLNKMDQRVRKSASVSALYAEFESNDGVSHLINHLKKESIHLADLNVMAAKTSGDGPAVTASLVLSSSEVKDELEEWLKADDEVRYFEWV